MCHVLGHAGIELDAEYSDSDVLTLPRTELGLGDTSRGFSVDPLIKAGQSRRYLFVLPPRRGVAWRGGMRPLTSWCAQRIDMRRVDRLLNSGCSGEKAKEREEDRTADVAQSFSTFSLRGIPEECFGS